MISRPCYDKPWHCPGSAGPGWRNLHQADEWCDGGSVAQSWQRSRWPRWRHHRCPKCGTVILPPVVRWLDPSWWRIWLRDAPGRTRDRRERRQVQRARRKATRRSS